MTHVSAETVPPTLPMTVKRSKLGWPVREDLIKACKQIALDSGRKNYEVLEQRRQHDMGQVEK
jgi:hypothetical protein